MADEIERGIRRKRRWPWVLAAVAGLILLLVAAGYFYNLYWQHKVDALLASYRAKGEPVTWEEALAARNKLPAEQNSALIFQEALALLDRDDPAFKVVGWLLHTDIPGSRPAQRTVELMRAYLKGQSPALAILHDGAALPTGVYPLPPTRTLYPERGDYLRQFHFAVRLCCMDALRRALDGDANGAVESLVVARRLCASLGACWTVPEETTRAACSELDLLPAVERILGLCSFQEQDLGRLRRELVQEESELTMAHAFMSERASGYYLFNQATDGEMSEVARMWTYHPKLYLLSSAVLSGIREHHELDFYAEVDRYIELARLPVDQMVAHIGSPLRKMDESLLQLDAPPYLFPRGFDDLYNSYLKRQATATADLRVAQAALAVEQWRLKHGRWPDGLQELVPELMDAVPVDPYGSGTVRCKRTERGVTIYSVGPDGKDDGGVPTVSLHERNADGFSEIGDLPFHLLNPELRGVTQMNFADEVRNSWAGAKDLAGLGLTVDELRALGVDAKALPVNPPQ